MVPTQFKGLIPVALLKTNRGFDIGAAFAAKEIADTLHAPLIEGEISRLIVDLNRSLWNKTFFSEFSRQLDTKTREDIVKAYYAPYREKVLRQARAFIKKGLLIHLSIHSFTPILNGKERRADVGLLYDPRRRCETLFCNQLRSAFKKRSALKCIMNSPYRGTSDGLVTFLRTILPQDRYIGIEIEINQKFPLQGRSLYCKSLLGPLLQALESVLRVEYDRTSDPQRKFI